MQSEAEAILEMSETIESANFTRDQSDAFIRSMALAMKTFAVTPQILDERLGEHKRESNRRFDGIDNRLATLEHTVQEIKESMHELQRTQQRYFLGFTLTMLVGILGILATQLAP